MSSWVKLMVLSLSCRPTSGSRYSRYRSIVSASGGSGHLGTFPCSLQESPTFPDIHTLPLSIPLFSVNLPVVATILPTILGSCIILSPKKPGEKPSPRFRGGSGRQFLSSSVIHHLCPSSSPLVY